VKEIVRGYKDLLFTQYSAFLVISLIHPTLSSLIFDANDPSHRNIRNSIFALSIISHTQPLSTEELKQHMRVLKKAEAHFERLYEGNPNQVDDLFNKWFQAVSCDFCYHQD
jgi:hypothetical protein